jgi:hypothetical protein
MATGWITDERYLWHDTRSAAGLVGDVCLGRLVAQVS